MELAVTAAPDDVELAVTAAWNLQQIRRKIIIIITIITIIIMILIMIMVIITIIMITVITRITIIIIIMIIINKEKTTQSISLVLI